MIKEIEQQRHFCDFDSYAGCLLKPDMCYQILGDAVSRLRVVAMKLPYRKHRKLVIGRDACTAVNSIGVRDWFERYYEKI